MADSAKALIIEDDAVVSKVLSSYLSKLGLSPHVCEDVIAGLQHLAENPDTVVAFVDLNLKPYSGYAFLRALAREDEFSQLKKVMVTGEAKKAAVQAAIHDGAKAYILKPVKLDMLKDCLQEIGVPFTEPEAGDDQGEAETSAEAEAAPDAEAS